MKLLAFSLTIILFAGCANLHKATTSPVASTAIVQSKLANLSQTLGDNKASAEDVKRLSDQVINELQNLDLNK